MPGREIQFSTDEIYHIFTKTLDHKSIFRDNSYPNLFLKILHYYRSSAVTVSFSDFKNLPEENKIRLQKKIDMRKYFHIEVLSYCIMPTHFHLLIRQVREKGITTCISNTLNSFTRTYNLLSERMGPIFLRPFKSVEVRSREQFIHVSRYIHLNPYSSSIVSSFNELLEYPYSSIKTYLNTTLNPLISDSALLLGEFQNDCNKYKNFLLDNADYQQHLERLKYLQKWE
ncbi:MAG: hypothetical protein Q7S61_03045 [bacterium]|nr:hypothetical protein [bacterium]